EVAAQLASVETEIPVAPQKGPSVADALILERQGRCEVGRRFAPLPLQVLEAGEGPLGRLAEDRDQPYIRQGASNARGGCFTVQVQVRGLAHGSRGTGVGEQGLVRVTAGDGAADGR